LITIIWSHNMNSFWHCMGVGGRCFDCRSMFTIGLNSGQYFMYKFVKAGMCVSACWWQITGLEVNRDWTPCALKTELRASV
jgi:hypothetical protein